MKFKPKPKILSATERAEKEKIAQKIIAEAEGNKDADESFSEASSEILLKESKPWRSLDDGSLKEVIVFSLRVPKEEMLQLKFLSSETMISINSICLTALRNYLKRALKDIQDQK